MVKNVMNQAHMSWKRSSLKKHKNTSEADPVRVYDSAEGINSRVLATLSPLIHPKRAVTFNREAELGEPNLDGEYS
jgi:hypothetical protein